MAAEKDVFKILEDIEHRILGINDDPKLKKEIKTGFLVSFLQAGESVNPIDYENPSGPGVTDEDITTTTKRQEALTNLCELVDKKLALDGSGLAMPTSTRISQSWEVIIAGANAMADAGTIDAATQKSIDDANKLLFEIDATGNVMESKAYLKYQEYQTLYNDAVDKLSDEYLKAREDTAKFQLWPKRGLRYKDEARAVWDKWMSLGKKQQIQSAIDFLSAQGTDAAVKMIANAKKRIEDNRILLGNNEYLYVRVRPTNWCDPDAVTGWAEYSFDSSKQTDVETTSKRKWAGKAGFWKIRASASSSKETTSGTSESESVHISFNYAFVTIDRPYLNTLLPNLTRWYMKGNKKGCVSKGTIDQQRPNDETCWLPAIPTKMIVVKNITINSNEIKKNSEEIKTELKAGGSIGWSMFSGSGSYEKGNTSKRTGVEMTSEGLIIHGAQIIGWVSEILPECPVINDPSLQN